MKYSTLILILFFLIPTSALSQRKNGYGQNVKLYPSDRVLVGINYLQWNNIPAGIGLRGINRGFYLGYFLDNPIGGSRFSIGVGLSFTANNLYSDAIPKYLVDSASNSYTDFIKIKDTSPNHNKIIINKMTFSYASIPLELRLRLGKNELLKMAAGFEVGYMISSYVKFVGDDIFNQNDDPVKFKFYDIENTMKLRYGLSFRMGYNRFNFRIFYPLTSNFILDKGPQLYPIELGLTLMVF